MTVDVCPYVQRSKSWLIKSVLTHYIKAAQLNREIFEKDRTGQDVTFARLKELSELLYRAKEDLHLIYKRLQDPRRKLFENVAKCQPNEGEQNFIHNIGLLFHKATVARELQYMLEYYESAGDLDYREIKRSLHEYIEKLMNLFEKGTKLLVDFLMNFRQDVVIISYFYENQQEIERAIGLALEGILKDFDGFFSENTQVQVADYFLASGWSDRAKKVLLCTLELYPNSVKAAKLLSQVA